jgi:putative methionine-R-sulfoxide reductase with GAF domain
VLRLTAEAVAEALDVPMVSVYLVEEGALQLHHADRVRPHPPASRSVTGITGRVAATGVPALVDDVAGDPDFVARSSGVVSEVAVPLEADGEVLGVLNAESGERAFTDDDLRLLSAIRDQVAVAVQRARLLASVRRRRRHASGSWPSTPATSSACTRPSGAYTYVSPAVDDAAGVRARRAGRPLALRPDREPITTSARPRCGGRLAAASRPDPVAYRVRTKDGRTVWLETSAQPIRDPGGEPCRGWSRPRAT